MLFKKSIKDKIRTIVIRNIAPTQLLWGVSLRWQTTLTKDFT